MRKKGFTLIELLAVIIILAVIALVATPVIINVIEDAQDKANRQSVNGIIDAARNYYAESLLNEEKSLQMNGKTDIYEFISVTGEKPTIGNLFVNKEGQIALVITIDDKCYKKNFNGEVEELTSLDEECKASSVINDDTAPIVNLNIIGTEGNNGWYKSKVFVEIKTSDIGTGVKEYSWCSTTSETCTLSNVENTHKKLEILNGYKLCAQAIDKSDNSSEIECTDIFKIDTEAPIITGLEDIIAQINDEIDLETGIEVEENVSGIDGDIIIEPSIIDTTIPGVQEVKYIVKDLAGNENIKTRNVIISEAPSISYSVADGVINENGWAKSDFYVTINVEDNSGQGIKEIKLCTATTDRCEPSTGSVITDTTATRLITQEGSNRICVQATDNYNHTSEVICSDVYKLDKTLPTVSYSVLGGTYNEYKTIRITPNDDNYSYMNVHIYKDKTESEGFVAGKSISNSTENYFDVELDSDGKWYIFTTVLDKAGNIQNQEPVNISGYYYQTYVIDTEKPTLELDKYTYIEGFKGWTYSPSTREQDGIVYLTNETGSTATLPYYAVNNSYWTIEYDAFASNKTEATDSGAAYGHVNYYDENFNSIVAENGYSGNGYAKQFEINNWYHVTFTAAATNIKYVKWYLQTHEVYSTGPVQIKNFKIKGQLYQDFYNITVKTSDSKGIEVIKYSLGEKDKTYFENNGTIVTPEEVKVTENGTYTFYVKDTSGNVTMDTIVVDKIEKNAPIITAKNTSNEVIYKVNNDIKTYFETNQNGEAAITQTTCTNKTDGSVITNTNELEVGTHTIECSVLKANNKDAKATTTIKVIDPDISLSKSLDTNNKYLLLEPTLELNNASYTWYKNGSAVSNNKEYTVTSTGTYKVTVSKDGFSKSSNEFVVNDYQSKNDKMLLVAKEDNNCILRRNGSNEIEEFGYNDKCTITTALNMVKNGYLEYKDNTNFTNFTYDADADALYAKGAYTTNDLYKGNVIPVDYNKKYFQSIEIKSASSSFNHLIGFSSYDIDYNIMVAAPNWYVENTLTYLTQDLKNGDTVVYLNDVSNFETLETTPYYRLGLIFWNYKDSKGNSYPELTYSRNYYHDLYSYTGVNKENNTITLKEPWKYGTISSGTKLSQSNSGANHNYGIVDSTSIPSEYTKYENNITGRQNPSQIWNYSTFKYGTEYIKFALFINYASNASNTVYFKNLVITEE